jgi:hypothetical protein
MEDCNRTIHLSKDKMKTTFTSPEFPRFYPDNINCFTFFTAPVGYRILVEFEELVLESESMCSYDYLEMFELDQLSNSSRIYRATQQNLNDDSRQSHQQFEFQQLYEKYLSQQSEFRTIFYPSNLTYNSFQPPPTTSFNRMPRKICGDWSSKLKLLRYRTKRSVVGFYFHSDYSHHHGGFKAKVSIEKGEYIKFFRHKRVNDRDLRRYRVAQEFSEIFTCSVTNGLSFQIYNNKKPSKEKPEIVFDFPFSRAEILALIKFILFPLC